MSWILVSGLLVLVVLLVIAYAFEAPVDRTVSVLTTISAVLLALALLLYSVMAGLQISEPEVAATFSVFSGILSSVGWLFILLALIRLVSVRKIHIPERPHQPDATPKM